MKTLELNQMEVLSAGFVEEACLVVAGSAIIWEVGAISNFWNPIGWVSISFLLVGAACVGYGVSQL